MVTGSSLVFVLTQSLVQTVHSSNTVLSGAGASSCDGVWSPQSVPDSQCYFREGEITLAHSLRMQSITVGKSQPWKVESAGHKVLSSRKQRDGCWCCLTFSCFFSPGPQSIGCCRPYLGWISPPQWTQSRN